MVTKQQMIDQLQAANALEIEDMAERAARREMYGDPEVWEAPTKRPTPEPEPVRRTYEPPQQRSAPEWDAETEARWNAWFDARFKKIFWKLWADELGTLLGTATGKHERKLREDMKSEFAKVEKKFAAKLLKMQSARSGNVIDLPNPIKRKQSE